MEHIAGQTLHTHIRREEGPGRLHGGRVPQDRQRGLRRPRRDPRAGPRPRRSEAGQRHGHRRQARSSSTSASRRSAPASRRGGPARRPTAARRTTCRPSACAPAARAPKTTSTRSALTLWEMWTCRVPEPGYKPARQADEPQIMFDVPSGLSIDEVKQIFRCLSEDPRCARTARHLRFFNPTQLTTSPIQVPRERLDPGPPPGARRRSSSLPARRRCSCTYATNAPEIVGQLFPLEQADSCTIGRRGDQDSGGPRGHGLGRARGAALAGGLVADRRLGAAPTAPTPSTATSARRRSR